MNRHRGLVVNHTNALRLLWRISVFIAETPFEKAVEGLQQSKTASGAPMANIALDHPSADPFLYCW